ncbi:MAG: ATP-binding protein [Deltaproteobacteria bacterium]|nr:ATP-binding protein [Deltaproteobacteria bacterium]
MKNKKDFPSKMQGCLAGPFLQPLALAGVCFVFIALLFGMAAIDFRTLDKTLTGYAEKQGVDFIKSVQQAAGFNLQQMNRGQDFGKTILTDFEDQQLSLQESLILLMLQLAQRIDYEADNGSEKKLETLATKQGVWNLALFNNQGTLTFKKRFVPDSMEEVISKMIQDHEDLKIRMFEPAAHSGSFRFFALRRKNDNGFVVLIFDQEAYLFWKMKTAFEMAVDAVGLPPNFDCFFITDHSGLTLFQTGNCGGPSDADTQLWTSLKKRGEIAGEAVVWNGRKQLMLVQNILLGEGAPLLVRLSLNTDDLDRMISREKTWGVLAMGFMVLLAVLSMGFLYRNQNRHIAKIRQMERRLQKAERLSSMGRLASGVAHEIRNPLNAISMACQRLKSDNLEHLSSVIRDEVRRLNIIIEEFLGLSKGQALKLEEVDLSGLVRKVGLLMGEESRSRGIEIQTRGTESRLMMVMDGNKIKQALINIVKNAVESIPESGMVTIEISSDEKGTALISVKDTGTGVLADDVDEIFNLDFTTKEKGLGLGLALAHEIVVAHGGEIRVRSAPGVGTTFLILLPVKVDS